MPQSLSKLLVHIVFSTKNRFPFLTDIEIRKQMHAFLAKIFKEFNSHALIIGGTEDHVHILCNLSRTEALSKIIGESKRTSSLWLKEKGKQYEKFHWQRGYAAFSVSIGHKEKIINYILNQDNHHKNSSFKSELKESLKIHKIEYDEEYVWD